jgi:replicative DNA helicase
LSVVEDSTPPIEVVGTRHTVDGYDFVFDEASVAVTAVWGRDDEILHVAGEPTMNVAPEGVGKTSIAQQHANRRAGIHKSNLLGHPVVQSTDPLLYFAADRPQQAARSWRRMLHPADETKLRKNVVIHRGPPPFDVLVQPTALRDFALERGCRDIYIDSLKDIAVGLAKDEVGAAVSIAFQYVVAAGIELFVLHHQRKQQAGGSPPKTIHDVYGSRWLTACMGSVILLWGDPGDAIVEFKHLKQPMDEVGPFQVLHDHGRGLSTVYDYTALEDLLARSPEGLTVRDVASVLFRKTDPPPNEIQQGAPEARGARQDTPRGASGRPDRNRIITTRGGLHEKQRRNPPEGQTNGPSDRFVTPFAPVRIT